MLELLVPWGLYDIGRHAALVALLEHAVSRRETIGESLEIADFI
jgi:hypothetical protein